MEQGARLSSQKKHRLTEERAVELDRGSSRLESSQSRLGREYEEFERFWFPKSSRKPAGN